MYKHFINSNGINILKKINTSNYLEGICKFSMNNDTIIIYSIDVKEQYRNNKIGTNLLKMVEICGKENNIKNIKLTAYSKHPDNLEDFYIKNGYKNILERNCYNYDDGNYIYNLIQMEKQII